MRRRRTSPDFSPPTRRKRSSRTQQTDRPNQSPVVRSIVTPGADRVPAAEPSWLGGTHDAPEVEAPDAPSSPERREIVKGDTLWELAEELLGDPHRWPELYEANQETIGDNPDLILPGQQLDIGRGEPEVDAPEVLPEGPVVASEGPVVEEDLPHPQTSEPAAEPELTEREIHDERVVEILGEAYQIEEGTEAHERMLEWLDPLGEAPSASDYLTPATVAAGYGINADGDLEYAGAVVSTGDNAVGADAVSTLGGLEIAAGAHAAWDQSEVGIDLHGGHYTATGNAIDFLGGPIGTASETDVWDWGVGVEAELRGVSVSAGASQGAAEVSAFHTAIQNFPIDGLSPDVTDPVSMVARQAYIDDNPDEFQDWMLERRAAVLGGAETVSEFDWQNLGAGEAASFSEFGQHAFEAGAGYGVGVSLGRSEEDAHEVTLAMDDAGMLDVAITAMDQGAAEVGFSVFGTLELGVSAGEGHVSQVRFSIDTKTADGRQQAEMFTRFGLLPGALDGLDPQTRASAEAYMGFEAARDDYPFGDSLTPPEVDIGALVADANAGFLEANDEGPLPIAGATSYQNMELAEIETGGARVGASVGPIGIDLWSTNYERILAQNRFRNEQGLTESEFSATTSIDTGSLDIFGWEPFGDGDHVDSFAVTNPEESPDIALFAGISGDYDHDLDLSDGEQAAYTVTIDNEQMEGLDRYLEETGGAEEALFNEDAAEYYFTASGDVLNPSRVSYEGHDGDTYTYQGNVTEDDSKLGTLGNNNAVNRADATGMSGHIDQLAIERYALNTDKDPSEVSLDDLGGDLDMFRAQAASIYDQQFQEVTTIDAFRDLEDPILQSAYIQSAAIRLSYEDKNPALAFSLAFELEDPKARDEVIRDVLAHLPQDGVQYLGSLVEDAQAHDPELAVLLGNVIEEGAIDTP